MIPYEVLTVAMRRLATFTLGAIAGVLLALLLTSNVTSRQASAPRPAVVTPLVIGTTGTPAADRGADSSAPSHPAVAVSAQARRPEAAPTLRPALSTPGATPHPTHRPRATTRPAHGLRGTSTWYSYRRGQAAAGPRLRAALGAGWRGETVLVNGVPVLLSDFMGTRNRAKVIDLDDGLFIAICGPLSMGVCEVEVRW